MCDFLFCCFSKNEIQNDIEKEKDIKRPDPLKIPKYRFSRPAPIDTNIGVSLYPLNKT